MLDSRPATLACVIACLAACAKPVLVPIANSGFEQGKVGDTPPGWFNGGQWAGYPAALTAEQPRSGRLCALLRSDPDSRVRDYGVLSQMIDTTQLRGKRVRLRIAAHAEVAAPAFVYLFCRIDRPGLQKPFFQTRRISGIRWRDYEIAAPVAIDAERLEFGLVLGGDGRVWADDAVLEVVSR